ncbi:MAG: hypothetical protein KVP17_002549 [Porospora cf. gigantea B]|uniref:uncharacterized protein n=1 Tax=Porospora cf. gigantea B TaxID=2853592 RepID=UPI0035717E87|nr:MAG: hypothetical protein KVP17_002549 [Porospora cf. gigantea B]
MEAFNDVAVRKARQALAAQEALAPKKTKAKDEGTKKKKAKKGLGSDTKGSASAYEGSADDGATSKKKKKKAKKELGSDTKGSASAYEGSADDGATSKKKKKKAKKELGKGSASAYEGSEAKKNKKYSL